MTPKNEGKYKVLGSRDLKTKVFTKDEIALHRDAIKLWLKRQEDEHRIEILNSKLSRRSPLFSTLAKRIIDDKEGYEDIKMTDRFISDLFFDLNKSATHSIIKMDELLTYIKHFIGNDFNDKIHKLRNYPSKNTTNIEPFVRACLESHSKEKKWGFSDLSVVIDNEVHISFSVGNGHGDGRTTIELVLASEKYYPRLQLMQVILKIDFKHSYSYSRHPIEDKFFDKFVEDLEKEIAKQKNFASCDLIFDEGILFIDFEDGKKYRRPL